MKIEAVVFDFGGVMTTSTMPQRVMALAEEKGIDWNVFRNGFDAHRLDYDSGRITLDEMYALIWRDAGLKVSAETNAAFSNDFQRLRPVMVAFRDQVLPNVTEEMRLAELPKASLPHKPIPEKRWLKLLWDNGMWTPVNQQ